MSKLIKITAAVAILIGVSVGCSKFLDLDPPTLKMLKTSLIMRVNT